MPALLASAVISAPIDTVWSIVRDFGGIADWMPGIARCHIEDGLQGSVIGCVRHIVAADPPIAARERLLALDDHRHAQTYSILEIPLPVEGYVGHVQLYRVTHGDHTFIHWSNSFRCPAAAEAQIVPIFQGILDGAVLALQRRFAGAT